MLHSVLCSRLADTPSPPPDDGHGEEMPSYPEWKVIEMVDLTLLDADRNRDGLLSWPEYKLAESRQ